MLKLKSKIKTIGYYINVLANLLVKDIRFNNRLIELKWYYRLVSSVKNFDVDNLNNFESLKYAYVYLFHNLRKRFIKQLHFFIALSSQVKCNNTKRERCYKAVLECKIYYIQLEAFNKLYNLAKKQQTKMMKNF